MSGLSDLLSLLGLSQPGGPVSSLHQLVKWVSLPWSTDGPATFSPQSGYRITSTTRDLAPLNARLAHFPSGTLAALKTRGLVSPDPADNTKFQVSLELRIVYPAVPGQLHQVAGTGKLPVVLLNHGQHHLNWQPSPAGGPVTGIKVTRSLDGYAYLQDALAQHGIISVSVDHNFANFTEGHLETRADTILAALTLLSAENADQTSRYFGRLDFTNVGLMGHSRGGDAVVRAVQKITASSALSSQYTVEAVCSLAPTDFTGTAMPGQVSLGPGDTNFYLVVYGALDADVFGGDLTGKVALSYTGSGFRHYDRADVSKAMVFLDNCCHNPFNTVWLADGNDSNDSRLANAADHQSIAVDYIGDLFRWQLKGEALGGRFDGRTPNSAGQHAALQWRFGQTVRKIEDFETGANDLGGARTLTNPGNVPATIQPFAKIIINGITIGDSNTCHQTNVLHVDVTQAAPGGTRVMSTDIPATSQDWSGLDTLIFSLSGWFDPTSIATVAAASLPRLTITLLDASGASAAVDFNVYGATLPSRPVWKRLIIQVPHQPVITLTPVLMRLETIPIALTAFAGVSLSAVAHLALDIVLGNNTHVFVDNISVVKRQ